MDHLELEAFDRAIIDGSAAWSMKTTLRYFDIVSSHPAWFDYIEIKKNSMLSIQTLLMMRAFALSSRSAILEIGPYVGGSTIALGLGLKAAGSESKIISVDAGGEYLSQPHLPSTDIHADWRKNIDAYDLRSHATLVEGFFHLPDTVSKVRQAASGRRFDVLFIDANGDVQGVLQHYGDQIDDNCLLIIDDYFNVHGESEKISIVQRHVNALMLSETIQQYALMPFSTWFGRLTR